MVPPGSRKKSGNLTPRTDQQGAADSGHEALLHELAALRGSEGALRDFIETSTIGLHWVGPDGTILWVNQAELDLLGYERDEYVGRNIAEFHADESGINDALERLKRGETLRDYPARLRHRDGSIRHVLINSSVLFEDGKFVHTRCFTRDVTGSKHMEEALRKSEERFRLAIQATNDAIWDIDLKTGSVTWNETYSTLYGRPPDMSDSWQWWVDNIHADDRERTASDLRRAIGSDASSWTCEYRFRRIDGEWAYIYDRAYIARDASGNAWRVIGAMQDLTVRKKAEADLRESEERFRHMADAAPVMIWVTGPDKRCTFFNKPWLDFTGRTMEQELNNAWVEGIHPEDKERCSALYHSAFDSRRPFQKECRLLRADGVYRWFLDNAVPIYRDGEFAGYIGSCIDITTQKLIEERLRASEVRLMSAQRLAKLGSWERDDITQSMELSDEMLRILGMPDQPPQSLADFLEYVHPEDRTFVWESALQVRLTGAPGAGEYRIVRANGEVRFVRSILESIRDERGAVIRMVGVTQDITDVKRAQEESFAHQKLESVGTLASGIAHDFNNLLGGILAESELALTELGAGLRPEEELKAIRDVALRGSEIVRQLMVYAGKESAAVGEVDLSLIVREMVELLKVSMSKHAKLEMDLGGDLPAVHADAAALRQVVMNLVTNASEAIGDRDGVIRVATRQARANQGSSEAIPGLAADIDYVQLEVSDTGCGMPPDIKAKVFDPFFTTKIAGHGLGLAIADGIVRSLHGKILVASEPGKGTTFQIWLPASRKMTVASLLSPVEEAPDVSKRATVLVVEDEDVLRQAAAKSLRRSGFEVLEAATGSAAIDVLRVSGGSIDVILLDLTIPGPSSAEVAAAYAQVRPDAKVILTSAYSEELARATVPQLRAFIRKPFHIRDLVNLLRSILSS